MYLAFGAVLYLWQVKVRVGSQRRAKPPRPLGKVLRRCCQSVARTTCPSHHCYYVGPAGVGGVRGRSVCALRMSTTVHHAVSARQKGASWCRVPWPLGVPRYYYASTYWRWPVAVNHSNVPFAWLQGSEQLSRPGYIAIDKARPSPRPSHQIRPGSWVFSFQLPVRFERVN